MSRASTRAYGPGAQATPPTAPSDTCFQDTPPHSQQSHHKTPTSTPRRQRVQKRTAVGPWDFVKSVGAGSMGQVKLAVNRYTRQPAAVKIVPKAFTVQNSSESNEVRDARIIREAALGKLMDHPNIARLYEVYSMTSHYYLVFEYISGGQLLEYIITHGSVAEVQVRRFAREIASSLDYCHRNSIVHRDLKIENILVSDKGQVKIIDFGLSNMFRRDNLLKTFCGSLYFAAPELLNAQPYVGPEIDIWSFGVVLYVLVCGKVPFEDMSMSVLHSKIKKGDVTYPHWLSPLCVDLLKRMLVVQPADRASLREIIHHPWINKGYDDLIVSHVPHRVPLQGPLDHRVLVEMSEMQLGDTHDIKYELEAVLNSHAYQDAVKNYRKEHYRAADPLNSFHPLISLYFLTRERLERLGHIEPLCEPPARAPPVTVGTIPATAPSDHGTASDHQHPRITVQEGNSVPTRVDSATHTPISQQIDTFPMYGPGSGPVSGPASGTLQPSSLASPQHRATRMRSRTQGEESRPHGLGINEVQDTNDPHKQSGLTSLFRHISFRKKNESRTSSPSPQRNRDRSATTTNARPPVLNMDNTAEASYPVAAAPKTSRSHTRAKSTSYTHYQKQSQHDPAPPVLPDMPSISAPKQVFFKGFFSVQSTSNRPLVQLRADIIRVLSDLGIEFVEIKGGFSCIHGHAANGATVGGLTPSTPRNHGHSRKISMGTPISSPRREPSDSGYSSSNESFDMGGSDMLGHVGSSGHSPVRFEISIVKVPVISLHGIQFKKMGGNSWQYKTIAQEILEHLHL